MSDTEAKIIKIIAQQLNKDENEITRDDKIVEDLGADSLDVVELSMALEEEFNTKIPDEETEKMTTVGAVIDYVESKAGSADEQ